MRTLILLLFCSAMFIVVTSRICRRRVVSRPYKRVYYTVKCGGFWRRRRRCTRSRLVRYTRVYYVPKCCPGWRSLPYCSQAICNPRCVHGRCTAPNKCTCNKGWTGSRCEIAVCTAPCGNGKCVAPPAQCGCNSGWGGKDCNTPICSHSCHHGTCASPNKCVCSAGYTGGTCNTPICAACVNGECTSPSVCTCKPGWSGTDCGTAICSTPCTQGFCSAPNKCSCHTGWAGSLCSVPVCKPQCANGGICEGPNKCQCPSHLDDGGQCESEVCSGAKDCYPGTCKNDGTGLTCACNSGFSGDNCQTMVSAPLFKDCEGSFRLEESGNIKVFLTEECPYEGNTAIVFTNQTKFSHVEFQTKIAYEDLDISVIKPAFLKDHGIGIINAKGSIRILNQDNNIMEEESENCGGPASTRNPKESIFDCVHVLDINHNVQHGYSIHIELTAQTGGFKHVSYPSQGIPIDKYYNFGGRPASTDIYIRFDTEPPKHCTQMPGDKCISQEAALITLGPDVIKSPHINISFYEWTDADSGIGSYRVLLYALSDKDGKTGYLKEAEYPIDTFTFSNKQMYRTKLPKPGYYSVIGEISDKVGNVAKVRSTILYDDESKVEKTEKKILIEGAKELEGMFWFTSPTSSLDISWVDRYVNRFIDENRLYERVQDMPDGIDDDTGILNNRGFQADKGVSKYSYKLINKLDLDSQRKKRQTAQTPDDVAWTDVNPFKASMLLYPGQEMTPDDIYTLIIKAEDIFGNTATDYSYIRLDDSPPVNDGLLSYDRNVSLDSTEQFLSSVDIPVKDTESGINKIEFVLFDKVFNETIVEGTQFGQMAQEESCDNVESCYCTNQRILGECFESVQKVYIDNCKLVKYLNTEILFKATVYNMASITTPVRLDIEPFDTLNGIDSFPPLKGLRMDIQPRVAPKVEWSLPVACYDPEYVKVKVQIAEKQEKELLVAANIGEVTLTDLRALDDEYTVTAQVVYSTGHESSGTSVGFMVTEEEPKGSNGGAIAGIVIVVLVVVGLIIGAVVFVLYRRGRIHFRRRSPEEDLNNLRNNLALKDSAKTMETNNPAYVTGPGNDYPEPDETYVADDDLTGWKQDASKVEVGALIKNGKFAQINKGVLRAKNGKVNVAAKVAKDPTDENNKSLVARMEYLGNTVHRHPNLLNLVGGVESGPMMLLELCDEVLLDWLKALTKINTDVLDDLLRISMQCARGLESLHKQKIVHRRIGARNVFLTHENRGIVAKLGGLCPARTLNEDTVPIKWLALEQIGLPKGKKRVYNRRSDIWSFGVLLWEIFSKGEAPFKDVPANELKHTLDRGTRLACPYDCPQEWYDDILAPCWHKTSTSRPVIGDLVTKLDTLLQGGPAEGYYDDSQLGQERYAN